MHLFLRQALAGTVAMNSVGTAWNANLGVINLLPTALAAFQPLIRTTQGPGIGMQERYYASKSDPQGPQSTDAFTRSAIDKAQFLYDEAKIKGKEGKIVILKESPTTPKPANAFSRFAKSQFNEAAGRVSSRQVSVVMKELSAIWKGMSEDEKRPYRDEADKALADYKSSPDYQHVAQWNAWRKQLMADKYASGYSIFTSENLSGELAKVKQEGSTDARANASQAMKRVAAAWKNLSDDKRKEYNRKALARKSRIDSDSD